MPRIKVVWNDTKLVVPIQSSNPPPTINKVLQDISVRFRKYAKDLDDDNYFIELRTSDGFLLEKNDPATDVIGDGETIIPVDYKTWFMKFKEESSLENWLQVTRSDFVDDKPKWIQVGHAPKTNQIYIEFGEGLYDATKSIKFHVFDEETINSLSFTSKELIDSIKSNINEDQWHASAHFITSSTGRRAIELIIKSMSDPQPQVEVIEFGIGPDGKFEVNNSMVIQEAMLPPVDMHYKLPKKVRKGPVLKEDGYPAPVDPTKEVIESIDESPIHLQQIGKVFPEQSWNYSGAWQILTTEFRVTNNSHSPLSIVQIESEILSKSGEWQPALTYSGSKRSEFYYETNSEADAIIRLGAQSVIKLAIKAKYTLDYTKYKSLTGGPRRVHSSLPNPCSIRYTVRDQEGKKSSIVVQAFNSASFPTQTSYEADRKVKLFYWIQCDDVESEERMYIPIEHKPGWTNQNVLEIWIKEASRKPFIDAETLKRWAWLASKEGGGNEQFELKDWNWEDSSGTYAIKFFALFSKKERKIYGMKVTLKTKTGFVEDSFLLPKDIY
ncbi:2292_t:CDS:2 [Paraglomus brasilianum]|uniref:2292_t:CDS:1 n=1 Tax=Paraglomus brasilianum TaxID=144538 RepID=A0A9N9C686_9GLOM|nr:2292_t:CDS:2 [Paraglomus brasilianum]